MIRKDWDFWSGPFLSLENFQIGRHKKSICSSRDDHFIGTSRVLWLGYLRCGRDHGAFAKALSPLAPPPNAKNQWCNGAKIFEVMLLDHLDYFIIDYSITGITLMLYHCLQFLQLEKELLMRLQGKAWPIIQIWRKQSMISLRG